MLTLDVLPKHIITEYKISKQTIWAEDSSTLWPAHIQRHDTIPEIQLRLLVSDVPRGFQSQHLTTPIFKKLQPCVHPPWFWRFFVCVYAPFLIRSCWPQAHDRGVYTCTGKTHVAQTLSAPLTGSPYSRTDIRGELVVSWTLAGTWWVVFVERSQVITRTPSALP